jgi:hypothetical protein
VNLRRLPRVADPDITNRHCREIHTLTNSRLWELTLLLLVLVVQHEDRKGSLLALPSQLALCLLDVLLQLPNRVFQRRPGVIDLVYDEHVLANQVGHLQTAEVEPLSAGDFGSGLLEIGVCAEGLVK